MKSPIKKCEKCNGHGTIEDWYYLHHTNGKIYDKWKDIISCPQCFKKED